jgi:hypothetical protein
MSAEVDSWSLNSEGEWKRKSFTDSGTKYLDYQDQMMGLTLENKRMR